MNILEKNTDSQIIGITDKIVEINIMISSKQFKPPPLRRMNATINLNVKQNLTTKTVHLRKGFAT